MTDAPVPYTFEVALAYAIAAVAIGGLVAWTVLSARAAKARLGEAEDER